ncbi:DUF499 domain-containing protein [Bifidobacterium tibiigranuli]|jgi:hypothetical protein|uniref:DUF499 domain-containing protein n=1 Tax=Bifidobacterium tibiigranuli TaxID=2172043 RepID=UPI0026ECA834|nr:DUF499 domain-containing protein [Bifidobacterium tibiigranuli]MCI2185070.1 DUF499 domain-containing protein [Bifidobacterium tibiigranuli]MCI2203365.1 DUF499 domain-containing protein [Bifidobacterium tibiigranuli]
MAVNNLDRVGNAFKFLSEGLQDPVDGVMTQVFDTSDWNQAWAEQDAARHGTSVRTYAKNDVQIQLRAITEFGREFNATLPRAQQSYASELRETRNQWAHLQAFDSEQTLRALSTIELLLEAVAAPDSAADVRRLRDQLQRTVYEDHTRQQTRRKTISVDASQGMKPWREVIRPHSDVASGSFTASEFAADLYQVAVTKDAEQPGNPYGDPVEFFGRTYLTEGLKDLLSRAMRRLVGDGQASPVVNLQTNFGGGKTHSLLALYHLFGKTPVRELSSDVQDLVTQNKLAKAWEAGSIRRVAIVGTYLKAGSPQTKPDGTEVNTIWGELAWQLGGREAYDMVAQDDSNGTNPGSALDALLRKYSPALILIDEWVAYARDLVGRDGLPGGPFDTQFTFAQTLTEAVSAVPHCMLVVSIPAAESGDSVNDIEVGGSNGRAALERLRNAIGRKADQWQPSTRDESFEIVRKRLFEEPDAQAQEHIALTARQFVNMYRNDPKSYPSEVSLPGPDYESRIRASYPLHPELLDRLYEDWAGLEKFQRTRGVLKLVSSIIHELWVSNDASPLILPGNVPLGATSVNTDLTGYLQDSWKSVIDTDIDGDASNAALIDANTSVLGSRHLTERVARTVFLGSAPRADMPTKGIGEQLIWLGVAIPGDVHGNFGSALNQLQQRSTYLFSEHGLYWYSTQPSIAKTAREYAERFRENQDAVFTELVHRLEPESRASNRGDFRRVCVAPSENSDIPDIDEVSLVIVHPKWTMGRNENLDSDTMKWIRAAIERRGTAARENRNMLIFLIADRSAMESLKGTASAYLGWKQVESGEQALNIPPQQARQVGDTVGEYDKRLDAAVKSAYCWCVYPEGGETSDFTLAQEKIPESGGDTLAHRVCTRLGRDNNIIPQYAANNIGFELIGKVRPAFADGVLSVKTLWSFITKFPYMPRLLDRTVLDRAIEGVPELISFDGEKFALADRQDPESGRLVGLIVPGQGESPRSGFRVTDSTLLVDWDMAMQQLEQGRRDAEAHKRSELEEGGFGSHVASLVDAASGESGNGSQLSSMPFAAHTGAAPTGAADLPEPEKKTRYFANVELEANSLNHDLARLNDGILGPLLRSGASITLNLEVHAEKPEGFTDSETRAVTENAHTLKIENSGFEEE